MATIHSIIPQLPGHDAETHSPVRDDSALGADEDLDRQPDGVPHSVVGLTAGFSITVLALLVAFMFLAKLGVNGHRRSRRCSSCSFAIPALVARACGRARPKRDRDTVHPSR